AGTSRTTTGRRRTTRMFSKGTSTSSRRRTRVSASLRRWPRSRSRSTRSRTATRSRAWRWEPDERSPVARRVLRAGALRPDVVPADGAGAVRATDDELDGGDASLLRRLLPAGGGSDPVLRQVRARRHARRRPAVAPVAVLA